MHSAGRLQMIDSPVMRAALIYLTRNEAVRLLGHAYLLFLQSASAVEFFNPSFT